MCFCRLVNNLSVEYHCDVSGPESPKGRKECDSLVPPGTIVTPICSSPGYFSRKPLEQMHCINGSWNYNPICKRACGITTQHRQLEGTSTNHLELPWHAIIYKKVSENYTHICSGSLISSNTVISVAHCFWRDLKKLLPVSDYAVAVGKLYRPYKGIRDRNTQQSNAVDIRIPPSYEESAPNYQDDIAIVVVEKPFQFLLSVQPVCLDFDDQLDRTQLTRGSSGKAVGWKISGETDPVLTVVDLPYLTFEDCTNISTYFRKYLTREQFCARSNYDSSLCRGDSGGGFAVLEPTTQRYYLRSVISGALFDEDLYGCFTINTYSSILKHEHFIKQFL